MIQSVFAVAVLMAFTALGAEPPPDLMERLAQHSLRIEKATRDGSYTVFTMAEELDGDGKVLHTEKMEMHVSTQGDHRERTLIKAERDGKDVTDERRKKLNSASGSLTVLPFAADEQPKYRFSVVDPDRLEPSLLRIHIEPKGGKRSEKLVIADAIVDPVKGEVVQLSGHPSENPSHVDRIHVRIEFNEKSPVGRLMSEMNVQGDGGFLFIKKHFRSNTTFSGYNLLGALSTQ